MAVTKYISLPQLTSVVNDITTKADARFLKVADAGSLATLSEVGSSVLSEELEARISSLETTSGGLGALAVKDEVAESDLASELATKINGKADSADLGALASKDEVAESDLASALATKINGKADTADLGALASKDSVAIADLASDLEDRIAATEGVANAAAPQATTYTKTEVDNLVASNISSTYKAAGSSAFANLPTPAANLLGNVYNVTDAFTTTGANFVDYAAGNSYPAGTNVVVVEATPASGDDPATYKYDVLAGWVDLSNYATIDVVTTTANGLMSSTDKVKLDDMTDATTSDITALTNSIWPASSGS